VCTCLFPCDQTERERKREGEREREEGGREKSQDYKLIQKVANLYLPTMRVINDGKKERKKF